MGVISRTGDLFYAYRFLKLLVTPWTDTEAYKLGVVDENGKTIKKASELKTSDEKSAYTVFHRLVFNIKRLLEKIPFGKSRIASWVTALYLIKEETGMSEKKILSVLKKMDADLDIESIETELNESTWYITESNELQPGIYSLVEDSCSPITGEIIAKAKTKVRIDEVTAPIGYMLNTPIYKVKHIKTGQDIFINSKEIIR